MIRTVPEQENKELKYENNINHAIDERSLALKARFRSADGTFAR